MVDDEIVSWGADDVFREYTVPSDIRPDGLDSVSNISNISTDLSDELSYRLPHQFTGEGVQSTLISVVDRLNIALGTDIGSMARISLEVFIIAVATYIAAKMVKRLITIRLPKFLANSKRGFDEETEKTFRVLIARLLVVAIYVAGFFVILSRIPTLNSLTITLLAGAGVAGLAIGFAAQDSLSNIISGIFLAVFHPFRVGDLIDFNGEYGQVEDLTLRHTTVKTWDGRRIFVPNSFMGGQSIINWSITDPIISWWVDVGIGYSADIDRAREIMIEAAKRHPLVLKDREITVRLTELGDFAVNLRLLVDVPKRDVAYTTGCEIREEIKKRFDEEGIEIPYPYRNLIIHGPAGSAPVPEDQGPFPQGIRDLDGSRGPRRDQPSRL